MLQKLLQVHPILTTTQPQMFGKHQNQGTPQGWQENWFMTLRNESPMNWKLPQSLNHLNLKSKPFQTHQRPKKSQNPEDKGRIFHWFPSKMVESWPHCPTMPGRKGGPWIFWIRPRHQGKAIEAAEINAWKSPMGSQCHWIGLLGKILTGNPWLFTIK